MTSYADGVYMDLLQGMHLIIPFGHEIEEDNTVENF